MLIKAILRVRFFIYRRELTRFVGLRHKLTGTGADFSFRKTVHISPDFLIKHGIKGLILDVDNTLTTHDDPVPAEGIVQWLDSLRDRGIKLMILSNNHPERVTPFAKLLGLDCVCDGAKPLKKGYVQAMKKMGLTPEETAGVGDQLFTDIWGAKAAGIRSIYVQPIATEGKDKRFIRFKRVMERPFLPEKFIDDKRRRK